MTLYERLVYDWTGVQFQPKRFLHSDWVGGSIPVQEGLNSDWVEVESHARILGWTGLILIGLRFNPNSRGLGF